jgi:hypothetical protein
MAMEIESTSTLGVEVIVILFLGTDKVFFFLIFRKLYLDPPNFQPFSKIIRGISKRLEV